ncbi:MAG: hypothetical protein EHM48_02310, partial [Planctomycetaceae bacterium]
VDMIASLPEVGNYFSMAKLFLLVLLTAPWLLAATWINTDTKKVHAPQFLWNAGIMAVGGLGVAIWLIMPIYIVGLLLYVVLAGAVLGAYVVYRNGRVEPHDRVLTAEHLGQLFSSTKKPKQVKVQSRVKLYNFQNKITIPPDDSADETERNAYNDAQDLLYDLLYFRASEADLMPTTGQTQVRFVIDGVVVARPPMEQADAEAVIQYLKGTSGMNPEERRRPQQGKIAVDVANSPIDMMLISAGTTGGQRMQFKIVQEVVQTNIELLGMSDDVRQTLGEICKQPGLVIISGRSGSGVTSSLYSVLRVQDAFTKQLVTLESKIVVDMENITQAAYGEPANLAAQLTTTLRRDPDLLMIDRCEDAESAQLILNGVAEKTVILGMNASDSFVALGKWIKLCGDASQAVANLNAILCQVLVRKLCPTCREAYRPDPQFLAKANLPANKIGNFYRPPTEPLVDEKGNPYTCPTCQGNGYFGRTGIFELLIVTDEIRQLIASGAGISQIQAACRKNKMLYLQDQALRKVIEGVTSIQEVIRVTQPKKA